MKIKQPEGLFCQSCSMPLERQGDFGTNAAGSKSNDYCCFCFQDGKFTDPAISMEGMINKVATLLVQMEKMPESQAKEMAKEFIPKLKRWQH